MRKNKSTRKDNLSSVENNKKIYKMYKSKKTWVVAPVVLGALALGFATPIATVSANPGVQTVASQPWDSNVIDTMVNEAVNMGPIDPNIPAADFHLNIERGLKRVAILQAYTPELSLDSYAGRIRGAEDTATIIEVLRQLYSDPAWPVALAKQLNLDSINTINGLQGVSRTDKDTAIGLIVDRTTMGGADTLGTPAGNIAVQDLDGRIKTLIQDQRANMTTDDYIDTVVKRIQEQAAGVNGEEAKKFYTAKVKDELTYLGGEYQRAIVDQINTANPASPENVKSIFDKAVATNTDNKDRFEAEARTLINDIRIGNMVDSAKQTELDARLASQRNYDEVTKLIDDAKAIKEAYKNNNKLNDAKRDLRDQITRNITAANLANGTNIEREWHAKVNAATTLEEVNTISQEWTDFLTAQAQNFKDVAKKEIETKLVYLTPQQIADYVQALLAQREPAGVQSILDQARNTNTQNKTALNAAKEEAYKTLDGLNLTAAQRKGFKDTIKDDATTQINGATNSSGVVTVWGVNEIMKEATRLSNLANLADAKRDALAEINKFQYLVSTDPIRADFVTKITNVTISDENPLEKIADLLAQAKLAEIQAGVAKESINENITKARTLANKFIDDLKFTTQDRKNTYKQQIAAADTTEKLQAIVNTAATEDNSNRLSAEALKELEKARKDAIETINVQFIYLTPSERDAFISEVKAAQNTDQVDAVIRKARNRNTALQAAAQALAANKATLVTLIQGDRTYTTPEEKAAFVSEVNAATDSSQLDEIKDRFLTLQANRMADRFEFTNAQTQINTVMGNALSKNILTGAQIGAFNARITTLLAIPSTEMPDAVKAEKLNDIINEIAATINGSYNTNLIPSIQESINKGNFANAQKLIDQMRDGADKREMQGKLNAAIALAKKKAEAADFINDLDMTDDEKAEAIKKVNKMESIAEIDEFLAQLAKDHPKYKGWNWNEDDLNWYYYKDGKPVTGWFKTGGVWYHFDKDGKMATGWKKLGDTWYHFSERGYMATGWKLLGGVWYHFNENGYMATGWKQLGGVWYHFGENGYMATGWKQIGGVWYHFGENGYMATGWRKLGGVWYYFKSNGAMVANTTMNIAGKNYTFNNKGYWVK